MKRLIYLLPLALFCVLAAYLGRMLQLSLRPGHDIHELPSAMIEKPAPAFDLTGLVTRQAMALAGLKGHPVIINFFASWCVPCRIEHPLLMRLARAGSPAAVRHRLQGQAADGSRLLATFGDPYRQVGEDLDGRVGWISVSMACRRPMWWTAPASSASGSSVR